MRWGRKWMGCETAVCHWLNSERAQDQRCSIKKTKQYFQQRYSSRHIYISLCDDSAMHEKSQRVYIPSKSIICVSSARTTSGHYKKVFPTGQNHCDLFTFVIPSRSLSPYHLRSTISCWRFYESSWWFYREWVWKSGSGVLKCMGREKKWSQNLNFLRLRGAKSQNWFASTHFLRPEIANSLWSRKKS